MIHDGWRPEPRPAARVVVYTPSYFPAYVGGGERLAELTAAGLRSNGADASILTITSAGSEFTVNGVPVHGVASEPAAMAEQVRYLVARLRPNVVHMVGAWRQEEVSHAARDFGARLGAAGLDYGQFCDNHLMLRGSGRPCRGRMSSRDCFNCSLERAGARDRLLARIGRWLPGPLPSLIESAARSARGRPMGSQLRWARQFRQRDASRRQTAASLDLFVAPTRFGEAQARPHVGDRTRCASLMYPVADGLMRPEPKQTPGDRLVVGFVGRCLRMKGLHVLLDAVAGLAHRIPVSLRVETAANDGDEPQYRQAVADQASRMENVEWHESGALDTAALRRLHAAIDVLAVPSVWPEYVGFVTLESLALGTPVVLSDFPTQRELVSDDASGVFVTPGDAPGLAAVLEGIWKRKCDGTPRPTRCPALTASAYGRQLLDLYGVAV